MFKKIVNSIVHSSADPTRIALTLKAGIPFILFLLPLLGIVNIGSSDLVNGIEALAAAVAGLLTAYGLVRKVYIWIKEMSGKVQSN